MRLLHFMKTLVNVISSYRMSATVDYEAHIEKASDNYCKVSKYSLETYVAESFIAKAEADIMNYKQPGSMSTVCCSNYFSKTSLRRERVQNESRQKDLFLEGLQHN